MTIPPTIAERIRQHVQSLPEGEPFTSRSLLALGPRASVDQALSQLVKAEAILRITRGVFVRPRQSRFGVVVPEPDAVARAIADSNGEVIDIHGAEAARRLELTTQVPLQRVFLTSGRSRTIKLGKRSIRFQHVGERKLKLAGRPAGQALIALWYLGKSTVTPAVVARVRERLGEGEFAALKAQTSAMPAWMSDAFYAHENSRAAG